MDPVEEILIILIVLSLFFGILIFILSRMLSSKNKEKEEIKRMFNARESGGDLRFNYRNYDVLVTFRPDIKVSILHSKDVEDVKPPQGAQLTPMYLIFRAKKAKEIGEKIDKYVEFLESIPTQ